MLSMEDTVKIENRYVNLSALTLDEIDVLMGEDAAFGTYQWTQWTTHEIFVYNDSDATKLTDFSEGHFLLFPFVVHVLYGDIEIQISDGKVLLAAIYGCILIIQSSLACVANGLNKLKTQVWVYGIGALAKIPMALLISAVVSDWRIVIIANCCIMLAYIFLEAQVLQREFSQCGQGALL